MDKDKIIDYIVNEWAMHSQNGLVEGYDTDENVQTLEELLMSYGIDESAVEEAKKKIKKEPTVYGDDRDYIFKVFKPNTRELSHYISVGHPDQNNHPDKSRYYGPTKYSDPKMYRVADKKNMSDALVKAEKDEKLKSLRNDKSVSIANVQRLKKVFEAYPDQTIVQRYKDMYNQIPTIEEAIDIYTGKERSEFQGLINAIDEEKFAGGGRGEIPIVFILKGARSGGGTEMDILFAELENKTSGVEVKEVTGATIAISAPTLTGFSSTPFNIAIHELALAANKTPKMKEFLLKVLEDDGILYKKTGPFDKMDKYRTAINAFFDDPKVGEVSQFLLDAIFIVSEKLKSPVAATTGDIASIDIDIGNKHREFKIPDDQVAALNSKLDDVSGKGGVLDVPVKPKREEDDDDIAEKCMKLSFFKENWDEDRVQEEVMDKVVGKYKRMIIISKKKGTNQAELYKEDKIRTLEFVALGFGKVYMYVPGMGKTKSQAAGDIKQPSSEPEK